MEEDRQRIMDSVREYDDGTIDAVVARKMSEIAEMEATIEKEGPSRERMVLLKVMIEDSMLYNMVRKLITASEEEFEDVLRDIMPAFEADMDEVPRVVIDNYRRRLTEEQILEEDRAMGYVDDIAGIVTGRCRA